MKDFTHLVISRINCNYPIDVHYPQKLYDRVKDKQFNRRWIEERLEYMAKYTYPSLQAQTNWNFKWLILLHPDTPKDLIQRFREYKNKKTSVLLTALPPREYLPWYIQESVVTSWVATTTLDADDAIGNGYIELLQENFRKKREYLNVTCGFTYALVTGRFYGRKAKSNPFITLVEPTVGARGVYCVIHGAAPHEAPVRQLDDIQARWVQVAHGDNLLNRARVGRKHSGRAYEELRSYITMDI